MHWKHRSMTSQNCHVIKLLIIFWALSFLQARGDSLQDWEQALSAGLEYCKIRDWKNAEGAFEKATELARVHLSNMGSRLAYSQGLLAYVYSQSGKFAQADFYFDRCLRLYRCQTIDDSIGFASAHRVAAKHFRQRMHFRKTIQILLRGLEVAKALENVQDSHELAAYYRGLGISYCSIGEYDLAIKNFALCIEADAKSRRPAMLWRQSDGLLLVQCFIDSKNLYSADSLWQIIESDSRIIDSIPEVNALLHQKVKARLLLANGETGECLDVCRQAMARCRGNELEMEIAASDLSRLMGLAFKESKQFDSAEFHLNRARETATGTTVSNLAWRSQVAIDLAEVKLLNGTLVSCGDFIEPLRGFLDGDIEISPTELSRGWRVIVQYHLSRGESTLARIAFDRAMELLTSRYPTQISHAEQFKREFENEF